MEKSPKILSTAVLIFFLAILVFLCWLSLDLTIYEINKTDSPPAVDIGDYGEMALAFIAFAGAATLAPYLFVLFSLAVVTVTGSICFGFAVVNSRRSSVLAVKIINIVLSCCFVATAVLIIVTFILLRVL